MKQEPGKILYKTIHHRRTTEGAKPSVLGDAVQTCDTKCVEEEAFIKDYFQLNVSLKSIISTNSRAK